MNWEKLFVSKLMIAVPEVAWSKEFIDLAIKVGAITPDQYQSIRYWKGQVDHTKRVAGKLSGRQFTQRLLILAPELISTRSVDLLRRLDIIGDAEGHALRLFVRALTVTGVVPGAIPTNRTLSARLAALANVGLSQETIDLFRMIPILPRLGELSVEEATFLRGTLIGAERLNAARKVVGAGGGLAETFLLVGGQLLDDRTIRAMVMTGAISSENARILYAALKLGNVAWRTSTRVWNAAGFEQRALLASTGLLSQEMVSFLRAAGIIDARTARTLGVAAQMARSLARTRLDAVQNIQRSYRVLPGESPIATFARTSRNTEQDLIEILNAAAEDTKRRIAELAPKDRIGAKARAAQERILLNGLYDEVRALWEGVGYLTIIGERSAARAAVDSMDFLTKNLFRQSGNEADLIRRQLREAGRAGVDSLISREENLRPLSTRIYRNIAFANNLISRRIQINLIRGVSAKEFADDVARLFRTDVRGGVSYAAMRLARTEINNAFHMTSIRYTREMPWVTGYKWNLSSTHSGRMPKGDVCNDYASEDGYALGAGNYPKSHVPSKPHPQCLCFITIITMPPEQFRNNYRRGTFNKYLDERKKAGLFDDSPDPLIAQSGLVISSPGASNQ